MDLTVHLIKSENCTVILCAFLAHHERRSYMHLLLDEKQMHLLKTYSATLDPLEELSSAKSREDYVTASAVLLVVYFIEKIIIDAESRIKEAVTSSDNTTASASNNCSTGLRIFEKYNAKTIQEILPEFT
ncbi:uncharacterized protein LOC127287563 isoform X1 [Leptopilina boulardi]|uniref:uncharacterized protein LOC127287563 isoform X1 n=1 Tax=Leptopilina boulardi TaxID=63433 RepID=UPI0021F65ED6|nr:uncharacterized protein LOC127287563 isoform X1 [Leptopilina boulardi]